MNRDVTRADVDFARHIAKRHAPGNDDAESAAMLAVVLASRNWDGRGTFSGYMGQHVRWAILSELGKVLPEPIDVETLPDTTRLMGHSDPANTDRFNELHAALRDLGVEFLLDGVDRRRFADRTALSALRRTLE